MKSARRKKIGGGIARSRRDLTIPITPDPAGWRRSRQNLRENACPLVPRAIGGGVAERCEREGRLREILTEERIGRRDCKISSRSNYPYGRRPGMSEQIFILRVKSGPPPG